jgi:hypothetical protein
MGEGPALAVAAALLAVLSLCAVLHRDPACRMRALVVLQLLLRRKTLGDKRDRSDDEEDGDRRALPKD